MPEQFCGAKTRSNPACNAEVHSLSAFTDTNGVYPMAALAQGTVSVQVGPASHVRIAYTV